MCADQGQIEETKQGWETNQCDKSCHFIYHYTMKRKPRCPWDKLAT